MKKRSSNEIFHTLNSKKLDDDDYDDDKMILAALHTHLLKQKFIISLFLLNWAIFH